LAPPFKYGKVLVAQRGLEAATKVKNCGRFPLVVCFGFAIQKLANRKENAVKSFIQKYEQDVMGSLSGFDRLYRVRFQVQQTQPVTY